MGKLTTSENNNSRRNFLKNTGVISLGLAGLTAGATSCQSNSVIPEPSANKSGKLYVGKSSSLRDRIERVLVATIGMQRFDWEQGTVAQALLEMGEFDLVVSFARAAIMRQVEGRFSVIKGNMPINDCSSIGEAVLFAGKLTGDPVFMKGANEMLDVIKNTNHKNEEGIIYHTQEPTRFIMSDAFYMLPPFLAAAGEFDEAMKQIEGYRKYLYHEKEQLYSHIWDGPNSKFIREDFWGVGNGWTAAGLTRVIKLLPESRPEDKKRLIVYAKEVVDGCLKYLREDGLFHNVVNKPDTFTEVNLSQMISYTIFRGVAAGYLESSYLERAEKMRKAANEHVDNLGYVQNVCGLPNFDRPYVAPEGQAFYLLMETAAKDLFYASK
ncbi:MAG: glycoside hydrolase family 88 protein [Bacteroidota bacterium]